MSRIFSLFFILFFAFTSLVRAAETNIYLVEEVNVNVSGKTPSLARNAAIATARRDAFLILLTRLELNIKIADKISDEEISDMVRSEQIDGEKIAGNNYSATFNIMFAKDFVDHILEQKKAKKSDEEEKTEELNLLIPAKIVKRRPVLWEEDNDWKKAIAKNLEKRSQKKFVLPEADVSNIAAINRDNVIAADYATLEPVLSRYKSDAAYTLVFNYDEVENKVIINVSYIRKLQKKQLKLSFINVDRLNYDDLLNKVADKTLDYLLNSQNSTNRVLSSNLIHIGIRINSLGGWLMARNKIENSNLVNQLNIESLSRDFAVISVNYIDGQNSVEEGFAKIGIALEKKSENFYTFSAN